MSGAQKINRKNDAAVFTAASFSKYYKNKFLFNQQKLLSTHIPCCFGSNQVHTTYLI